MNFMQHKCINCLPSATNLVEMDADFTQKQPKAKGIFLWTTWDISVHIEPTLFKWALTENTLHHEMLKSTTQVSNALYM